MKFIKGLFLGLIIGAVVGATAGYNKGRGAPLHANPFEEYTLSDKFKDDAGNLLEDTKESLRKSLE